MPGVVVGAVAIDVRGNFSVGTRFLAEKFIDRERKHLECLILEILPQRGDTLVIHFRRASERCDVNDHGNVALQFRQIHAAAIDLDHVVKLEQSIFVGTNAVRNNRQ